MVTLHTSSKDSRFVRLSFGDSGGDSMPVWGGVSSIISAGIGAGASHYAARKYLQGVRETNETNLALAREQQAWDLAQWNRENDYNSAASQLQRWQQAGFSPQSFIGNTDVGNAAALQSPSLANQQAPGDLSGYSSSFAQSIQGGIKSALDWKQMELNQKQLNLDKERLANETKDTTSRVNLNEVLTKQGQANIKYIEKLADMTDEQRWKFRAEADLAFQAWEQRAKLFPVEYSEKESKAAISLLDKALYQDTYQERVKAFANQNGLTVAQTNNLLKQAFYWYMQGKEGEFQVSIQPLRFDLLNWQQQQAHFDLNFSKNTRYSQLRFENTIKSLHAFAELGHLAVDLAGEVRAWVHPSSYTWNYNFNPGVNTKVHTK